MNKQKNKALLFAGATAGLNNHVLLVTTPATGEFRHSSLHADLSGIKQKQSRIGGLER
jgi:hypothetical protein